MKRAFLFVTSLIIALSAIGQAKFYAQVNPKNVPLNQQFQLTYVIENAEGRNLKLPKLDDFQLLAGPQTSQSVQWINGNMTQSVSYTYFLKPKKEGTFKIGKAVVNISGANVESNEVSITVTAPSQQTAQSNQRSNQPFSFDPFEDPFEDPFDIFNQRRGAREPETQVSESDLEKQIQENVFLRLTADKTSVYEGEHLTASLRLYYRLNFGNVQMSTAPKFDGFWNQEIPIDPNQKPKIENINGKEFYVLDVQKYDLYPQRAGTLKITPAELSMIVQAQIQSKSRSIFDVFGPQVKNLNYKAQSKAISISVKPLPEDDKPISFDGAVGQLKIESSLSKNEGKTDEAITLSIKISGNGNLQTIEVPKPDVPEEFEVYDPKTKESISGMSGYKQSDYLLIPRQPGSYVLTTPAFSYFDPKLGKYVSAAAKEFSIEVTGKPSTAALSSTTDNTTASKEDIKQLGSDIRFIKTNPEEFKPSRNFVGSSLDYGLLISPVFLFFIAFVYKRKADKDNADIIGVKVRRANKIAKKRLSSASVFLKNKDSKLFYDEISRAVQGYLSDKLLIPIADLSRDTIEETLNKKGIEPTLVDKTLKLLETCDFALYANNGDTASMQQQYDMAVNIISSLDEKLA
jgi:hypothetical protein